MMSASSGTKRPSITTSSQVLESYLMSLSTVASSQPSRTGDKIFSGGLDGNQAWCHTLTFCPSPILQHAPYLITSLPWSMLFQA